MKDYSNYHNIDTRGKIVSDGKRILKHALENGYESEEVLIDGISTKAIIQSKSVSYTHLTLPTKA